jgi:DNA-binding XRE family transcriptional regulator
MMPTRTEKLIDELREWCDSERGSRSKVAREIGVSPQTIWNILDGRQMPTSEQALHIQELLRTRRLGGTSTRKPRK